MIKDGKRSRDEIFRLDLKSDNFFIPLNLATKKSYVFNCTAKISG